MLKQLAAGVREGDYSAKTGNAFDLSLRRPLGWVSGLNLRLLFVPYLAHDDHRNFNFLLRLRQPRNNCGKFVE